MSENNYPYQIMRDALHSKTNNFEQEVCSYVDKYGWRNPKNKIEDILFWVSRSFVNFNDDILNLLDKHISSVGIIGQASSTHPYYSGLHRRDGVDMYNWFAITVKSLSDKELETGSALSAAVRVGRKDAAQAIFDECEKRGLSNKKQFNSIKTLKSNLELMDYEMLKFCHDKGLSIRGDDCSYGEQVIKDVVNYKIGIDRSERIKQIKEFWDSSTQKIVINNEIEEKSWLVKIKNKIM